MDTETEAENGRQIMEKETFAFSQIHGKIPML